MPFKKIILLLITTVLLNSVATAEELAFNFPQPNTMNLQKKMLWATFYHIWNAKEGTNGIPLLGKNNQKLTGKITERDWCKGAIEGTILVTAVRGQKETYNYLDHNGPQQVDCAQVLGIDPVKNPWIKAIGKTRFQRAKGEYGDGVSDYKLIPYRTIAVDKLQIPYGSVIYIPQARGVKITLPSGVSTVHDGYFFAADTGGAIKGQHIDIFSGTSSKNPFPTFIKSSDKYPFEAYIVTQTDIIEQLRTLHK